MTEDKFRETAGLTVRLILRYVRRHGGDAAVTRLLALAGESQPPEVYEDEERWWPYRTRVALFDAAATVTGDPDVARRIGESVLHERVGGTGRIVLTALGSPQQLMRSVAKANAKFSVNTVLEPVEVGASRAVLRYALQHGYEPSGHNCGYTAGVLSQAPVLFGLPPAEVTHETCQVDGAPACLLHVSWLPRARRRWVRKAQIRTAEHEAELLRRQLCDLRSTVADLVSADDLDTVLQRIASRASSAVHAPRYLLAVQLGNEARPRIHAEGFEAGESQLLGAELLVDGAPVDPDPRSLIVEVATAQRRYGLLAAYLTSGGEFTAGEREQLAAYARMAGAALDAATALDASHRRGRTAERLFQLARALPKVHDAAEVAQAVAEAAPVMVGAERASVFLWDATTETATAAGTYGFPDELDEAVRSLVLSPDDTPEMVRMLAVPSPRIYRAGTTDPWLSDVFSQFGTKLLAVAPIVSFGELLGMVTATWHEMVPPTEAEGELLTALSGLSDLTTTALSNARLLERVRHQATHDALTGLPNRVLFADRVTQALAAIEREGGKLAVLFVDLDGFKSVNDSLGHAVGDQLLQQVAERLHGAVRASDSVGRLGGDEFAFLLRSIGSAQDASAAADQILAAFHEPFVVGGEPMFTTPSIGIALAPDHGSGVSDLLSRADVAMYAAKQAGRNTARLYGDMPVVIRGAGSGRG